MKPAEFPAEQPPLPAPTHTPGRILAAPMPFGPLFGLYDKRRRCFGTIGEPHGHDIDVVEANARRLVLAWNNYDEALSLALAIAADPRVPAELRDQARHLVPRLGGLQ